MTQKHTPTPWHTQRGSIVGNGEQVAIVGNEGQVLISDRNIADAAFIVRACNTHDELADAISDYKNAKEAYNARDCSNRLFDAMCFAYDRMIAALAKARGEA